MNPIDTYRDAFHAFLGRGMTHIEALREFEFTEIMGAALREIHEGQGMTLLELCGIAHREEMNERDMEQAVELWLAGWTSETPSKTQVDVNELVLAQTPAPKGEQGNVLLVNKSGLQRNA